MSCFVQAFGQHVDATVVETHQARGSLQSGTRTPLQAQAPSRPPLIRQHLASSSCPWWWWAPGRGRQRPPRKLRGWRGEQTRRECRQDSWNALLRCGFRIRRRTLRMMTSQARSTSHFAKCPLWGSFAQLTSGHDDAVIRLPVRRHHATRATESRRRRGGGWNRSWKEPGW